MKNIFIIDLITDDHSVDELEHLCRILNLQKINSSEAVSQSQKFRLKSFHLPSGNFNINQLEQADAVIISGSAKSVYEEFLWKIKLHQIIDKIIDKKIPAYAICFGAQFVAYHLGAKVCPNPKGAEFGPIKINLTEAGQKLNLLQDCHRKKNLFASHKDYIENLPAGATLLAWNDNSPIQAFQYQSIFASQFHTDMPTKVAIKLFENRKQQYLKQGVFKNENDFQQLLKKIPQGEESYEILKRFILY
jgi:GMP synthase (glutamine-hydrolysing)